MWCSAILCLLFSLILIFFGIATSRIFVAIKPRCPLFDICAANINCIYFDSWVYLNGDWILLANFSNPIKKPDVSTLAYMESVHTISTLAYMPPNLGVQLQEKVHHSNKVSYYVRGTFKVRATLGLVHFSYWLHGRCN
ncbi:uncharacterized protein LOC115754166 [Rhodamnia argentea]|uniref:Uncharacterized protein LOC115754166 n=1 Tax=Rhodamnia argentea TaxID=178133 RepID=A0ABM3GYG4_9MYRT|nr:uncharacterized protein LOC115754166 [Rhodamnia argentea]